MTALQSSFTRQQSCLRSASFLNFLSWELELNENFYFEEFEIEEIRIEHESLMGVFQNS
jgi:hypothetical protein